MRRIRIVARRLAAPFGRTSSSLLIAAEIVNRGGRFVLFVLLARELGPDSYGAWVVAAALATMLASAGDLGISTVVTTEVAINRNRTILYAGQVLAAAPIVLIAGCTLLAGAALTPGLFTAPMIVLFVGTGALLECVALLLLAPVRGHGNLLPDAGVRAMLGTSLFLLGGAILIANGGAQTVVAALFPALGAAAVLISAISLKRCVPDARPHVDRVLVRHLAIAGLPVFFNTALFFVYFRIDAFLLAAIRGDAAAGLYGAAFNFTWGLAFVPIAFGRALLPTFAAAASPAALRAVYLRALRRVLVLALVMSMALLLATPTFLWMYGAEFHGAESAYLVLIAAQALYFVTNLHVWVLYARSAARRALALTLVALAVNVALNLLFIPRYGPVGAALATLGSECVLLAMQFLVVAPLMRGTREPAQATDTLLLERRHAA